MQQDWVFFLGLLFVLFIIWAGTGGPTRPLSWAGPFLNEPAPLGSGRAYFLPGAGFGIDTSSAGAGFTIGAPSVDLNTGSIGPGSALLPNVSGASGEVYFSDSGANARETLAAAEYVTLRVASSNTIDITGWKLVSTQTGNSATLGGATIVPVQGSPNIRQDIVVHGGDTIYINTGTSPIGISFRENECTGYLNNYTSFNPDLANTCPAADDEYQSLYGDPTESYLPAAKDQGCWSFVQSLSRCDIPTTFPIYSDGSTISNTCQNFVAKHLNYNACVQTHATDSDFAGNVWHLYIGRNTQLWNQPHDTLELLDQNGKIVDVLTY